MLNFTCRGRTLQIAPEEAALALHGEIAPSLRQRSAVHFWRHGEPAQTRSTHEAVCTKGTAEWHLRSFGSHDWWAQAAREQCDAARWRALDSCKAYSLDDLSPEWRQQHGVNNSLRGAGWWRWKPYYLLHELRKLKQGDVVVHADYDLVLAKQPGALWCIGQNAPSGVAAFHMPCLTDRAWTKREVVAALGASDAMLDTTQIYAGLLILRRTPFTERFLEEWLELTLRDDLATDTLAPGVVQDTRFVAHRHDQSLLSLLTKRHRLKTFPLPTAGHDVRDVWSWDAGYCERSFEWPLPNYRPMVRTKAYPRGVYITHYKEMGHQRDTMEDCMGKEPKSRHLPLPDYVESAAVLQEMRAMKELERVVRSGGEAARMAFGVATGRGWRHSGRRRGARAHGVSPLSLRNAPHQPVVSLVREERTDKERQDAATVCKPNITFGGLYFEQRPYLWTARGCRGIFTCASSELRCGIFIFFDYKRMMKAHNNGRDWLRFCSCDRTEGLEAARHWRDGRDHLANVARSVTIEYPVSDESRAWSDGSK